MLTQPHQLCKKIVCAKYFLCCLIAYEQPPHDLPISVSFNFYGLDCPLKQFRFDFNKCTFVIWNRPEQFNLLTKGWPMSTFFVKALKQDCCQTLCFVSLHCHLNKENWSKSAWIASWHPSVDALIAVLQ